MLDRNNIKMIRSRPYHPQTQRKCERSHRGVRNKSTFLKQKDKDLTGQLKQTKFALNETPKEVLGYSTYLRCILLGKMTTFLKKLEKTSAKCYKRKQRSEVKKGGGVSIYNIGEHVLLRFPFSSRHPKRRCILRGKIIERKKVKPVQS